MLSLQHIVSIKHHYILRNLLALNIKLLFICFSGVLFLIGIIVFGAKFDKYYKHLNKVDHELAYSYGLAIVAVILEIVAGVLLILDGKKGGGTSPA